MSSSREESPDWLRSYQEPKDSVWVLSSDSESCHANSPIKEDPLDHGSSSGLEASQTRSGEEDENVVPTEGNGKSPTKHLQNKKILKKQPIGYVHTSTKKKKNDDDKNLEVSDNNARNVNFVEVAEKDTSGKHIEPHVSSSSLPLVLSDKVHRSKALIESEGDSIDLNGDMGAVGRVISVPSSANPELYLDLKGTIYKTTIVPSRTFCIVSFGQSEAKVEAIMNDFIQLKPQSNVFEAETMVEGTLEGFLFDSEDEAEKIPKASSRSTEQDGVEEQSKGKGKDKTEKASGVARKRSKTGGKPQPPKKVRKKTRVSKTAKGKK